MITLEEYLKDPCRLLSIPYWKARKIELPDTMAVVHLSEFFPGQWEEYSAQRYFRLFHDLKTIPEITLDGYELETAGEGDVETIASVINRSYPDIQVTPEQIRGYRKTAVSVEDLWIMVRDVATRKVVACAMADFDPEAGELSVEWVQVLPESRGLGIGWKMVTELLRRGKKYAVFATVSGRMDNVSNPEALYRKCGFIGQDIWYILRKA